MSRKSSATLTFENATTKIGERLFEHYYYSLDGVPKETLYLFSDSLYSLEYDEKKINAQPLYSLKSFLRINKLNEGCYCVDTSDFYIEFEYNFIQKGYKIWQPYQLLTALDVYEVNIHFFYKDLPIYNDTILTGSLSEQIEILACRRIDSVYTPSGELRGISGYPTKLFLNKEKNRMIISTLYYEQPTEYDTIPEIDSSYLAVSDTIMVISPIIINRDNYREVRKVVSI